MWNLRLSSSELGYQLGVSFNMKRYIIISSSLKDEDLGGSTYQYKQIHSFIHLPNALRIYLHLVNLFSSLLFFSVRECSYASKSKVAIRKILKLAVKKHK